MRSISPFLLDKLHFVSYTDEIETGFDGNEYTSVGVQRGDGG